MKKAVKLKFNEITVGSIHKFKKKISVADVKAFASLSGDFNPLHVDKEYASKTKFGRNIVHGMLAGSLFSTLVGMYCPGEKNLYLSQSLFFKKPIFIDEEITVRGTIINKNDSIKLINIKTEILRSDEILITGEAKVTLLE